MSIVFTVFNFPPARLLHHCSRPLLALLVMLVRRSSPMMRTRTCRTWRGLTPLIIPFVGLLLLPFVLTLPNDDPERRLLPEAGKQIAGGGVLIGAGAGGAVAGAQAGGRRPRPFKGHCSLRAIVISQNIKIKTVVSPLTTSLSRGVLYCTTYVLSGLWELRV